MKRKAIIISLSGKTLTNLEKSLIRSHRPWGIILFKRNIGSLMQTKKLITNIRRLMKDKKYPILIDEEGGRVTRLSNLIKNNYSQKYFGDILKKNRKFTFPIYKNYLLSIINILKTLGININTVPVLDVFTKNAHNIIGDRSYSDNISHIRELSELCIKTYKKNNIATVIKHIPGHGKATSDSHKVLPSLNISEKNLKKDFNAFSSSSSDFAMTAHILYKKIDRINCATQSKKIISKIIRQKIGFRGIIISDDISMKALKDDLVTNALKSLAAGCNLVLYCSGKSSEMIKLLNFMPYIDEFTTKKTSAFYKFLR